MKTKKQKPITIQRYNEIMSNIIKKGHPVVDTLVELLEEASKYRLPESVKRVKKKKKRRY